MNAGTIANIEGIEEIRSWENCVFFPISKNIGDTIKETGSWGQCVALIHFTYDTFEECKRIIDNVHNTFKVIDESGNNLVNRMLDFNLISD